jgi:hypothetical protein
MYGMENINIEYIRTYIAYGSIGASTVRGLRTKGVVDAGRTALKQVDLRRYGTTTETYFGKVLDNDSEIVLAALPKGAQFWGVARKILNIFLRNALYNIYLNQHYNLNKHENSYEIPLDSLSATGIINGTVNLSKLNWVGVKYVTPDINHVFQILAKEIANERNTHRVHLDAYFWGGR